MQPFKRSNRWGKGKLIHDQRANKTDYTVYIENRKDKMFNENIKIRENDTGNLIKLQFKPDGIYLVR